MKIKMTFILCAVLLGLAACGRNYENKENSQVSKEMSMEENKDSGEETEVDAINRDLIANALEIAPDSRNIRFILGALNTIGAGKLQEVKSVDEDGRKALQIIAEDGTNYCIYLSGSGSVEAIKNVDSGEWPIKSQQ